MLLYFYYVSILKLYVLFYCKTVNSCNVIDNYNIYRKSQYLRTLVVSLLEINMVDIEISPKKY